MVQLRSHLSESEFVSKVQQQQKAGYHLVYAKTDHIKAVAGLRIIDTLSHGKILYVDDLVTDTENRSQGYNSLLLDWLINDAKSEQCSSLQLDSGVQRTEAHRFYFRKRMSIIAFRFSLNLTF
jgi:ribosomal protein S18 acetylase RimI-like enzyme